MTVQHTAARVVVRKLEKRYDLDVAVPFAPARSLYNQMTGRRHAAAGVGAAEEVLEEDELDDDDDLEEAIAEEEQREAAADDAREYALRDVSFEVGPGTIVGIYGGRGAGKSTLMRVLAGVSVPTAGKVTLHGVVVPPPQLLSTFMRPDLNVGQNLRVAGRLFGMPRRVMHDRRDAMLEFAGMRAKSAIDQRGARDGLRRLGMAIAIGAAPDILLLDGFPGVSEAAYNARFVEALATLRDGGTTVIFATRPERANAVACDRLLSLDEGRLVEGGPASATGEPGAAPGGGSPPIVVKGGGDKGLPPPEMTPEMMARRELRPGGRTHPLLPVGVPGWPGMGFHKWAAMLHVQVRDSAGAEVSRISPEDELIVEAGLETGVRALQVHWSVNFLAEGGADIQVEQDVPQRYEERTVSVVTVRIAPGTLRPGAFIGRVEALISAVDRTYTLRRDAFGLVVEGDEPAVGALGPTVARPEAGTWSVRVLPPPELTLGLEASTFRH